MRALRVNRRALRAPARGLRARPDGATISAMRRVPWVAAASSLLAIAASAGVRADATSPAAPTEEVSPTPVTAEAPTLEAPALEAHVDDDEEGASSPPAAAPGNTVPARRTYDYSRFSDGPRRVPTPRGASMIRARTLGLGTREAANILLTRAPEARWVRASRGRTPRTLLWPVAGGRFGRGFGFTRRERHELPHNGVDIGADRNAPIRAVADGIVAYSDNGLRGYGNCVILVHSNGWVSLYAHNTRTTVQPGYRVRRGERIALLGSTGIARGPHLHFELRDNGRLRNPMPLFVGRPGRAARR